MANDELRIEQHLPSAPATPPERTATPRDGHPATMASHTNAPVDAAPAATDAAPEKPSLWAQMKAEDRRWAWKFIARCIIVVLDIIALSAAGAVIANSLGLDVNPYIGYLADRAVLPFCLIPLGCSFVWCLVAILVRLFRRPPRPVHPGVAVGIDLIIWLALVFGILFSVYATIDVGNFGYDTKYIEDPSWGRNYNGHYELAANGTWIYKITYASPDYGSPHYNSTTGEYDYPTVDLTNVVRDCEPLFDNCADQDAYINAIWQGKSQRYALDVLVCVCEVIVIILHFALFVQACVDTHKRNRGMRANVVTQVLQDMESKGLITVHAQGSQAQPPAGGWNEKSTPAPAVPPPAAGRYA